MENDNQPLLEISNLSVSFRMYRGNKQYAAAGISDLSLSLRDGEILAVVGASGAGKSLLAHAVLGLLPANAIVGGNMLYMGQPLTPQRQKELRGKEIALIPQSVAYLDPLMRVGSQVRGADSSPQRAGRQKRAFERLALSPLTEQLYPFQLSGGMARRVLFSTAIVTDARLILADEPTPGMHLGQALEALSILRELADEGRGVVLITHDIDLALRFADTVAVFYAGATMEQAPAADFIAGPDALRHPYSKAVLRALPQNDFIPIGGSSPPPDDLPPGCLFAPRCTYKTAACEQQRPPLRQLRGGSVRCLHAT